MWTMKKSIGSFCLISVVALSGAAMAQQVAITSPNNGTVVSGGQTISVQVSATPNTFKAVQLIAGPGISVTPPLLQPPYTFTVTIPSRFVGQVKLTALGIVSPDNGVVSAPIFLDSETNGVITSLNTDRHYYALAYVGKQTQIQVSGSLNDGSGLNLRRSSLVTFSSANSGVATVDATGLITATGPGQTTVTVSYGQVMQVVTVSVGNSIRGDLNGNGRVDQDDLNIILANLNTRTVSPNDARDLNGDGNIDALDARILTTLCTYPRCATHQ